MHAPSYTFLMGEYVSFLKAQLPGIKCPLAREYYEQRLKDLMAIRLEDLPAYQAAQLPCNASVKILLQKALY